MYIPKREFNDILLERGFQFIPQKEQEYISEYAKVKGICEFEYSKQEYTRLRKLAKKAHIDKQQIEKFDRAYCFTHSFARRIRTGAHNSMTGMCWDAAIGQYVQVAKIIQSQLHQARQSPS